jgi:hypothetical protein
MFLKLPLNISLNNMYLLMSISDIEWLYCKVEVRFYVILITVGTRLAPINLVPWFLENIRFVHTSLHIKVLFIHQLMHQSVVLKNNIKIYIKTVPTCFGVTVTPSSGSALIYA